MGKRICTAIVLLYGAALGPLQAGEAPKPSGNKLTRAITIEKRYLSFPVSGGAKIYAGVTAEGKLFREFDIRLDGKNPWWWASLDVSALKGKTIKVWAYTEDRVSFDAIKQTDGLVGGNAYDEPQRPQLHMTASRGWINDCAGMVYHKGEYHLFTLRNPYFCTGYSNTAWYHMVSSDLAHWQELGDHILPDEKGVCFTGSAVVDFKNTSGFQTGKEPPIVAIYTNAGHVNYPNIKSFYSKGKKYTQSLAYSNDRGRSWTKDSRQNNLTIFLVSVTRRPCRMQPPFKGLNLGLLPWLR